MRRVNLRSREVVSGNKDGQRIPLRGIGKVLACEMLRENSA